MSEKSIKMNNEKGFTLIELLLAVGIMSVVLVTLVFFTQSILDAKVKNETIYEVNQQGDLIMERLTRIINDADNIVTPSGGGSGSSLQVSNTVGSETSIVVNVAGGVLSYQVNGASFIPMHNDSILVSSIQFSDATISGTWDTIDIEFTLTSSSISEKNIYDYERTWRGTSVIRHYER